MTYLKHGIGYVHDNTGETAVTVTDPDNPHNPPIYDGNVATAHKFLVPGVYDATTDLDAFGTTLAVVVLITPNGAYVLDGDLIPITGMNPHIPQIG